MLLGKEHRLKINRRPQYHRVRDRSFLFYILSYKLQIYKLANNTPNLRSALYYLVLCFSGITNCFTFLLVQCKCLILSVLVQILVGFSFWCGFSSRHIAWFLYSHCTSLSFYSIFTHSNPVQTCGMFSHYNSLKYIRTYLLNNKIKMFYFSTVSSLYFFISTLKINLNKSFVFFLFFLKQCNSQNIFSLSTFNV